MKSIILQLIILATFITPLFAGNLDPQKLSEIRSVLSGTRHLEDLNELKANLEIYEADPSPYLIAIIQESGTRVYIKTRALNLLQFYPSEANSQFLESKISANNEHESVRKFAIRSYAISQKGQTTKVESFLGKYRHDANLGTFVNRTLKEFNSNPTLEKNDSSKRQIDRNNMKK
ncbi:hypothetical protein A0128_16870 [Leptospira tipperaryensis]|uniref:HEAT repeat domain-containing protein n=1 Tax=Leptospira tipperaryensis TaxID=2564040 RepID=A0A1D7V0L4_9LEPT|nr:hypothetical protein [Leptospira tipperaryensis]AOP35366.1 hypothetical protein A0128_16870 [Leptospira tipperaryensis]